MEGDRDEEEDEEMNMQKKHKKLQDGRFQRKSPPEVSM